MKFVIQHITILGLCLFTFKNFSFGQKLSLNDILTIYELDSVALKTFCDEKKFELTGITKENWTVSYTYKSLLNKHISFAKTFPKIQTDHSFLYYHYNEKKDYKNFKDSLLANGFEKLKSYEVFPEIQNYSDYRERYIKNDLELELSTSNFGTNNRAILLTKKLITNQ